MWAWVAGAWMARNIRNLWNWIVADPELHASVKDLIVYAKEHGVELTYAQAKLLIDLAKESILP